MPYQVLLRHNPTGNSVLCDVKWDWERPSTYSPYKMINDLWWWTEGNFGCDCNRFAEYLRAWGVPEEGIPDEWECGDSEYTALKAILPDGREYELDKK